jgi:hypothetical protein
MARLHAPPKPEPVAKYEAFVEQKLAQARGRIRLLDFTAGVLGFLIGTMVFALVMGWLDRWLQFSLTTRQTALAIYGLAAAGYMTFIFIRPWLRPLNPYYAARHMEQVLPNAKNSVINWLDLRHQTLPSAIRGALSHRAAKDISQANLEEAINGQRTLWLGVTTLILFLMTVAFMFFGPGLSRVFQPLGSDPTYEIRIVKPEGGNGTIAEGRAVSIEAVVHGRQTEPLRFLYRRHQSDSYEERLMERGETAHDWVITIPAFEVHNGFWYKVVGAEGATDEYHIEVRSAPAFMEFEINYHPRPYLRLPDEKVKTHQPDLKGIRGTEVTILARTNRRVRIEESGLLVAGQKDTIPAEAVADDSQAMRFHLILDKDGSYGIQFTSAESERNNPVSYSITVLPDKSPEVQITKPEDDKPISLPANGILQVEGSATDDHGLTGFTLQMQVKPENGSAERLPAKPYWPGKSFQLADGRYPLALDYQDFVELGKVRTQGLQPGTVIEYWLEATDNCDYPSANVGRSKSKFIEIAPPEQDPQKLEEKKNQAQKEKEQKQTVQDQKLKDQNQAKQDQDHPQENSPGNQKSAEEKRNEEIEKKLQEQLQQKAKEENPDGSKSDSQKDSQKGEGDKNPMGDQQGGKKEGQPNDKPDHKESDKCEGDKNPMGDQQGGKKPGQPMNKPDQKEPDKGEGDKKPNDGKEKAKKNGQPDDRDGKGNEENKVPQKPDSQEKGKAGKPDTDAPKGENKGQSGKDKRAKPEDDKGDQKKKDENKGSGQDSKPADKKNDDMGQGQANSNGPQKPGMKDQGPKKDGNSDQPGQEKPANPQDKKAASDKKESGEGKGASSGKDEPSKDDGPMKDKPESKDKSDSGQPKPNETQSGEKPGDQKDSSAAQTQKEISELVKEMKEGDPKSKEKAREQLQKMSEQAKTPAERQAAREALKQAGKDLNPSEKPAQDKKEQPGASKGNGEKKNESSEPGKNEDSKPGDKKGAGKGKQGDDSKSSKENNPSNESGPGKGDQEGAKGTKGAKGSDQNSGKPGSAPGGVSQGDRESPAKATSGGETEQGSEANKEFQKIAGALQLENYKKKITPEMLEKAKITPEEYKKFLEGYQEKLNREGGDKSKPVPLADPKRTGGSMTNRAPREVRPTGQKEDKLPQAGRGTAPPGYDEPYSEFKAITSKSSPKK